jgi:hydrogenase maturation protease
VTGPVVIGIGNAFRRDDGVGPAVAAQLLALGVSAVACPAEPTAILDAWDGAALAVLVDAAGGGVPGRIRQCTIDDLADSAPVSSHDLGLRQTYELGLLLGRAPGSLVIVTIDIADTGHGMGLSPAVAAALPAAVRLVEGILGQQSDKSADQTS